MLTDEQIIEKYGQPGDVDNITVIELPYPMRVSWDTSKFTGKMQCHKLLADRFMAVFNDIKTYYGLSKIYELGIDLFGGCLNVRLMRGSKKKWSRHSWGIAIDLDPKRNQLNWSSDKAQFSKQEYKPMINIFYKHGFINLGVEKNYDWMHFESAI